VLTPSEALNSDQVLALHRVSHRKFELSGLRTGSVKDQMMRAHLVVERLWKHNIIEGRDRKLIILGGGVAGTVAALSAVKRGVEVWLIESKDGVMRTQMRSSRRIDSAEYDWPQDHWNEAAALWEKGTIPLEYVGGRANALAAVWESVFDDWVEEGIAGTLPPGKGDINFISGVDANDFAFEDARTAHGDGVFAYKRRSPRDSTFFGAAISCIGFSGEKIEVAGSHGTFKGYEFWGSDPFEEPTLGLTLKPDEAIQVLLSGGGDGAQQDFQRALTGKFGLELYRDMAPYLPAKLDLLKSVLAEDAARRAFAWRYERQPLPKALGAWHVAYANMVDEVWKAIPNDKRDELAKSVLTRPYVQATWMVGGATPDFCYGLNRFLTLLLAKLHAEYGVPKRKTISEPLAGGTFPAPTDEVIVLRHWVQSVEVKDGTVNRSSPDIHTCGDPKRCLGVEHFVQIADKFDAPTGYPRTRLGPFKALVIRHGVEQSPFFAKAPISEQIVPFKLPA
jgi:hypothetical protein